MLTRPRHAGLALLGALIILASTGGSALADTELGMTGTVGQHSLVDTDATPGMTCYYRDIAQYNGQYRAKLRRIDVTPPSVYALAGNQQVGWRFLVRRFSDASGTWTTTYRSPVQKAWATVSQTAGFTAMGIKVIVPPGSWLNGDHHYFVRVKMFWYAANGTKQGTSTHEVDYPMWVHDVWSSLDGMGINECEGRPLTLINAT